VLLPQVRVKSLEGHTAHVSSVTYSAGDTHLASGAADGKVLLHVQLSGAPPLRPTTP
jgi:WD40 repeat protein